MSTGANAPFWRRVLGACAGQLIIAASRILTGVHAHWQGTGPSREQTLYFANHGSHGDFVLIWTTLPPRLRRFTRPVAAEDYWLSSALRRFIGRDVFNALTIRRQGPDQGDDPVEQMAVALRRGESLIMFPEGTRNTSEASLLPLKSGLYHLACEYPQARFVPVWLSNVRRVLPKGAVLPVPLACVVNHGPPISVQPGESKQQFLERARAAMLELRPVADLEREASEDFQGQPAEAEAS